MNPEHIIIELDIERANLTDRSDNSEERGSGPDA
jgi:hypothetical protein